MSAVYESPVQALRQAPLASHPLKQTRDCEIEVHPPGVNSPNLQIELLLESIESTAIREAVQPVFRDLFRLLDILHLFETLFLQIDQAHETLAKFELAQVEARSIVNTISSMTMQTSGRDELLMETLDGIAFSLGHDLQRVFDCQLSGLTFQSPAEVVIGELIDGHGLLTNCARQSMTTLARYFDPNVSLFKNSDAARLTESLLLCDHLTELIQFVRGWDETQGELAASSIVERVVTFRHGSMRLLMVRDWKEYEIFSARITLASANLKALGPLLDSFGCYLETLLRLVTSRAVISYVSSQSLASELECMPLEQ